MATIRAFAATSRDGLHSTPSRTGPEAASQTFSKGAVLISSSGLLAEAGADPTNIVGVAEEDASGTTSDDVRFNPAELDSLIFEGNVQGTGALNAIQAADRYGRFGIVLSGGIWRIDKDETTNVRVYIVDFIDAVGETNGRVKFKFIPAATKHGNTTIS